MLLNHDNTITIIFYRVPIAVDMFRKNEWIRFIKWAILSAIVVLGPMIWLDSMYYGKLVIAPLNLIMYNVFTNHGPDLYGTEPFSFYFINGFLNFNFVFIGALVAPLALVRTYEKKIVELLTEFDPLDSPTK